MLQVLLNIYFMHITIAFDGLTYFVTETIDTDGTMQTRPFVKIESMLIYLRRSFKLAENSSLGAEQKQADVQADLAFEDYLNSLNRGGDA